MIARGDHLHHEDISGRNVVITKAKFKKQIQITNSNPNPNPNPNPKKYPTKLIFHPITEQLTKQCTRLSMIRDGPINS